MNDPYRLPVAQVEPTLCRNCRFDAPTVARYGDDPCYAPGAVYEEEIRPDFVRGVGDRWVQRRKRRGDLNKHGTCRLYEARPPTPPTWWQRLGRWLRQ